MNQHHQEPDVAFGLIPELGVAAAVADDHPFLDEVLRKHHFIYSQTHDIYLLPSDTSQTTAVRAVAGATREFQDTGLSIAVDPKVVLSASPPAPAPPPSTRAQAAIAPSVRRRQHAPTSATDAPADSSVTHLATPRRSR
ncbi:hypothetical protein ACIRJS_38385 [Streptomyces sp. NPDC102340]|uniref:hypothetical protein n=1 Tax=unclassified Streptomyces TaxID=2593676 RepID=UPI0037F11551